MRLRWPAAALATLIVAVGVLVPTPASAATPDRWGFATVKDPTVTSWTVLDTSRQWGSWKSAFPALWADGIKLAPGRFLVRFPRIGAGSLGVPLVTPINRTGHYCELVRWYQSGPDEIVDVQCHKPGGARDDSPFTVLWTASSGVLPAGGGSHAYLQGGASGIVQAYNSTGAGLGLAGLGVGQWSVKLPAVGAAGILAGDLQVTAIQPNAIARRCKVYKWSASGADVLAYVFCFDAGGAPVDTDFTLSYHRARSVTGAFAPPKYFGYLASAAGGPTNDNYVAGVGANTIAPLLPAGRYLVTFPQLGQKETHAQVTAQGAGSNYCNLTQPWSYAVAAPVDVICFDNTGTPATHDVLVTFTSRI